MIRARIVSMTHTDKPHQPWLLFIGAVLGLILLGSGYLLYAQHQYSSGLETKLTRLDMELASTTASLTAAHATSSLLATQLSQTQISLNATHDALSAEQNRNQDFEDQINQLAGTVGILDKVSKTDPELLQKYSKIYFLNENYIPARIKQINQDYVLIDKGDQYFQGQALTFLTNLIEAAAKDDITLKIVSAYRSFETQSDLKGAYTQSYGTGANVFSADQGYSEHQLGTTVDLTDPITAGTYLSFKDTDTFTWLEKNAYKYGFVLSYPEGNSYYVFEPWHWRFVGVDLATDLHRTGANFYDWEQRKIDGYLVRLFD